MGQLPGRPSDVLDPDTPFVPSRAVPRRIIGVDELHNLAGLTNDEVRAYRAAARARVAQVLDSAVKSRLAIGVMDYNVGKRNTAPPTVEVRTWRPGCQGVALHAAPSSGSSPS